MSVAGYVMCTVCKGLIPFEDVLHFTGTLRNGYRGAVLGEENSEFAFCSLECLGNFCLEAGAEVAEAPSPTPYYMGVQQPLPPPQAPPVYDGGFEEVEDQQESTQPPPKRKGRPPSNKAVTKRIISKESGDYVVEKREKVTKEGVRYLFESPSKPTISTEKPHDGKIPVGLKGIAVDPDDRDVADLEGKVRGSLKTGG